MWTGLRLRTFSTDGSSDERCKIAIALQKLAIETTMQQCSPSLLSPSSGSGRSPVAIQKWSKSTNGPPAVGRGGARRKPCRATGHQRQVGGNGHTLAQRFPSFGQNCEFLESN